LILQPSGNVVTVKLGTPNAPTVNGLPGEVPISSDFTGAGRDDPAVFEPATGTWRYFDWATNSEVDGQFGAPETDIPVPRDYDGDGKSDYAVFRPDTSGAGIWFIVNSTGGHVQSFGASSDTPVPEPLVYLLRGRVAFGAPSPHAQALAVRSEQSDGGAAAIGITTLPPDQASVSADQLATVVRGPSVSGVGRKDHKRFAL
jgi:hypothetical protein